jgi:hypothetical protein
MIIMKQLLNFFNPKHYGSHSPESIPDNIKGYLFWPLQAFKVTFIIATIFFVVQFLMGIFNVHPWFFVIAIFQAGIIVLLVSYNILLLTLFVIFTVVDRKYFWLILQKASLLLLNVPVAVLYFYILNS